MEIRVCFELLTRDENGNIDSTFGLDINMGENEKVTNYQLLTALLDRKKVLRTACLDGIVRPEDIKIITPEEYDKKYGNEKAGKSEELEGMVRL